MGLTGGVSEGHTVAGLTCQQGSVCYLDAENGRWEIHRRVKTLNSRRKRTRWPRSPGSTCATTWATLSGCWLSASPTCSCWTTFRSLWHGEENDAGQVAACLDPLRSLTREHGVGVLLLHHSGKGGGDYRGSSAIGVSVDLGFVSSRVTADDEQRDRRRLHCWKSRPAAEPEDRWLALHVERGKVYIEPAESPVESDPKPQAPARAELQQILRLLMQEPDAGCDLSRTRTHRRTEPFGACSRAWETDRLIERDGSEKWWVTEAGKPEAEGGATPAAPRWLIPNS